MLFPFWGEPSWLASLQSPALPGEEERKHFPAKLTLLLGLLPLRREGDASKVIFQPKKAFSGRNLSPRRRLERTPPAVLSRRRVKSSVTSTGDHP